MRHDTFCCKAEEFDDPDFVPQEDEATELLWLAALALLDLALPIFDSYLGGRVDSIAQMENALQEISPLLGQVLDSDQRVKLNQIIDQAVIVGAQQVDADSIIELATLRPTIVDNLSNSTNYFADNNFNNNITPPLIKKVDRTLEIGGGAVLAYQVARDALDKSYGAENYWRGLSNVSTSRAYHYGLLKGASYLGVRRVRYTAVLDNRTSDICLFLDGKVWETSQVLRSVENTILGDPEDAKVFTPWIPLQEYQELTDKEMIDLGVISPPRHPHCRSILEVF